MKKQDNESLIQELKKRLDWYLMEASDEEFDADEVQNLMNLLDSLKADRDDGINEEFPVEEALSDFWKYCEEREEDERILATAEEEENIEKSSEKENEPEKKAKEHKVFGFFRRHKAGAVAAAAVLIVVLVGGSWQVVANAEKHGGFFWWMDKNEEGTTMITSPEGKPDEFESNTTEYYYKIEDVPEKYRGYVQMPLDIPIMQEYVLQEVKIAKRETSVALHLFVKNSDNDVVHFQIVVYPQEILRIRDGYPEYDFVEEFQKDEIKYEVFKKNEIDGKKNYIVYFYYNNVKYVTSDIEDENLIKEIAMKYGMKVMENDSDK